MIFTYHSRRDIKKEHEKTASEKRTKRRITAREYAFFIACVSGLKSLCHRELIQRMPDPEKVIMIPGGVEVSGTVEEYYEVNLHLRSPSRISIRIAKFKAENFRSLEKQFPEIDRALFFKIRNTLFL